MDYKYTSHFELQAPNYLTVRALERKISEAVYLVLEHAALSDGLSADAYQGDKTVSKGWAGELEINQPWTGNQGPKDDA